MLRRRCCQATATINFSSWLQKCPQQPFLDLQESGLLADSLSDVNLSDAETPLAQEGTKGPPPRIRTLYPPAEAVSPQPQLEAAAEAKGQEAGSNINVNTHPSAVENSDPDTAHQKPAEAEHLHEVDLLEPDELPTETVPGLSETRSRSL